MKSGRFLSHTDHRSVLAGSGFAEDRRVEMSVRDRKSWILRHLDSVPTQSA